MGVCGSQLARERTEFHNERLKQKDEMISDLREKTKKLEDEKMRITERNEFHKEQLQEKQEMISDLKEKTKTLEDEKRRILEEKDTLKESDIRKEVELKHTKEQLEQLQSENKKLKAEIEKPATIAESTGNILKKTGEMVTGYVFGSK